MRSITLKMCTVRRALTLLCLGLLLAGCGLAGGRGSLEAGARYQAEGKYRAAYIEAKKVLQHDNENGAAWLLLGKASMMLGNPDDALSDLKNAQAHGAPKAQWLVPMGQVLRATHQYDTLIKDITTAGLTDPKSEGQVQVLRGDAYMGLNQHDNATHAYQAALKVDSNNSDALAGLAKVSAAKKDTASANAYMQRALAAGPENPQVWLVKGDLALSQQDFDGAETDYQKALGFKQPNWLPQDHFYALTRLATAQAQAGHLEQALDTIAKLQKGWPNQPYSHYLHAVVLFKQGHMDEATSQLQQVLKSQPNNAQAQLLMGAVNYAQGNYAQAGMYLSNVMGMDRNNVQARKLLALTFYREGRPQRALDTLRSAAPGKPTDAELLALLQKASTEAIQKSAGSTSEAGSDGPANTQLAQARKALFDGQAAQAVRILKAMPEGGEVTEAHRNTLLVMAYLSEKRADMAVKTGADYVAKHPKKSAAHLLYGSALVAANKRSEARAQFSEAHELEPKNVNALLSLGSLEALERNYKKAAERYESALRLSPNDPEALTALGRIAMLQGDKADAIKRFKQAIAAAPKSPSAYLGLMFLYGKTGQLDEAGNTAKQLAKAAPDNPAALNALGATQLNAGHYDAALAPLQQAVKLAPDVPLFRINLARAQVLNKDTRQAQNNLMKVLDSDPSQVTAVTLLAFMKAQENDLPGAIALARRLQKQPTTQAAGLDLEGDLYMSRKAWSKAAQAYQRGMKTHYNREFVVKDFYALSRSGDKHPEGGLVEWLTKHPDDAAARLLLGQHYLGQAQNTKAADQYEKVLKAFPGNLAALNNLAWIYTEQRNPRALALAEKAYKIAPKSPGVADTYGWALIAADKPKSALPILTKAAREAPKTPTIQYHLAVAQVRTGDTTAARTTLQALQASAADFPEKQAAEKLFRDIGGKAHGSAGK